MSNLGKRYRLKKTMNTEAIYVAAGSTGVVVIDTDEELYLLMDLYNSTLDEWGNHFIVYKEFEKVTDLLEPIN